MAIDVSKFHQTFFDESLEGLEAMESGLLELEEGSDDNEAINTIFRAAHSIKGGAGTLGFAPIAEFTHLLETILDRRRSGRSDVTQETIDVLLSSVDCLRDMLSAIQNGEELDVDRVAEVEARLQELVDRDNRRDEDQTGSAEGDSETDGVDDAESIEAEPPSSTEGSVGWHIKFAPHLEMMQTGNDPVRILGELAELGDYRVVLDHDRLPDLEALDPEICHLSWAIELRPSSDGEPIDRAAVDMAFEWVEDEADITIIEIAEAGRGEASQARGRSLADGPAGETASSSPGNSESGRRTERRQSSTPATTTSIRVDIEKVDTLINMVGELVITQSMLQQLASQGEEIDLERLREGLAEFETNTRELQASVMQIRMLPISFAFSRLPRLVRDLASQLGKSVDLQINGETTELDKTVMEKIGDPLVHLVRNSLDHGLETPEDRLAAGKSETGLVTLSAYHEGGTVVIEISDDGSGLDTERILAKAKDRGLVGDDDQLTRKQIDDLIFHPGLSTAETVSDVSGRGVGMDVVKRNINDLSGVIEVVSEPGRGTTFTIRLPLTLAILDGQLVRVGDQVFVIPLVSIVESLQFDPDLTGSLAKGASIYRHREAAIPLIELRETIGCPTDTKPATDPLLVIVDADGARAGLIVDDLLGQQQIVIKSLTTNFRTVPGISGATILGDGTVAMIIDVNSVVTLYRQTLPTNGHAA